MSIEILECHKTRSSEYLLRVQEASAVRLDTIVRTEDWFDCQSFLGMAFDAVFNFCVGNIGPDVAWDMALALAMILQ